MHDSVITYNFDARIKDCHIYVPACQLLARDLCVLGAVDDVRVGGNGGHVDDFPDGHHVAEGHGERIARAWRVVFARAPPFFDRRGRWWHPRRGRGRSAGR